MTIASIILAGGEARRFGKNKLIEKINGKEIILRVLDAVPTEERAIIVGKYWEDILKLIQNEIIIYNPFWKSGLSSSLKLGIKFFYNYEAVMVFLGDMPLITKDISNRIIKSFKDMCVAIVPTYSGIWGNPVILRKNLFDDIMQLTGDKGAKDILKTKKNICTVEIGKEVLTDVDTESDLSLISEKQTL
ncbi:nucleotidyltransferase family protein [Acidianus brierleyi]|uniref:4-diphosphocytidyl-2C-methyl-D-erythritol kinase n=1 Tax=Acidianus brierleyi TaxID=41673 RepID=A0A2U9IBH9_9CREN|nr:nucleotidyltransferase family protein [Acidianus brierleyi]AWR93369.1 NTP transferase domain-containing protein [Acidianus brierleyi]